MFALHLLFAILTIGPLVHIVTTATVLMVSMSPFTNKSVAEFSETWIWLSLLLWLAAVAITRAVVSPSLDRAAAHIGEGAAPGGLATRIGASGGFVGLIFIVIVFLVVYQPGG